MSTREQLDSEIQRVQAEIQEVMDRAQPRGWWEKVAGVDEARIEEAAALLAPLREELAIYQGALREHLEAERPPTPPPAAAPASPPRSHEAEAPSFAPEVVAAACRLRDTRQLERQLKELHAAVTEISGIERTVARAPRPRGRLGGVTRANVHASFRRQRDSRLARTGYWDRDVADANVLAHGLGISLSLPRRRLTQRELALGATDCFVVPEDDFVHHVMEAGDALSKTLKQVRAATARIEAEEPRAATVPVTLLPTPQAPTAPPDGLSDAAFVAQWRTVLKAHDLLDRLRRAGSGRADMLGALQRWQAAAEGLRALAGDRTPLPPLNDGPDILGFVASLTTQRAGWETTLTAIDARARAEEDALHQQPDRVAAAQEAFEGCWVELLRCADAMAEARRSDQVMAIAAPVRSWGEIAKRATELAERHGFTPVPPAFDGLDARRFAEQIEHAVPSWRTALGHGHAD